MNRTYNRIWRMAALAVLLLVASTTPAAAAIVDFEDVDGNGNNIITSTISRGFSFTSEHFHAVEDAASAGSIPDQPGSNVYIGHEGSALGRAITMTAIGGSPFSVSGIDAGRLWHTSGAVGEYPNATHLELFATFDGGGTSTQLLPLPATGLWQTYPLSLNNLTSLRLNGLNAAGAGDYAVAVDNIRIVPEPVGPSLAILAVVGCSVLGRRRCAKTTMQRSTAAKS